MFSKRYVLDTLWIHSHFLNNCLYQSEEHYRNNKGFSAILVLFSCVESVAKSVVNDFDSSTFNVYSSLFEKGILTQKEHDFLNNGPFCLRKIRNWYAHADIATISLIEQENGNDIYWSLTEEDTSIRLYEKISDIVFNLILKMVASTFIDDVRKQMDIVLDKEIHRCDLRFRIITLKELLISKGFPDDYFDGFDEMPEHAKIRMIENAPDVANWKIIFSRIADTIDT